MNTDTTAGDHIPAILDELFELFDSLDEEGQELMAGIFGEDER
jgi:hypothetical protein